MKSTAAPKNDIGDMMKRKCVSFCIGIGLTVFTSFANAENARSFVFHYGAEIQGLKEADSVRVWMPIATSTDAQQVTIRDKSLGSNPQWAVDQYGNRTVSFLAPPNQDTFKFQITYEIRRKEVRSLATTPGGGAQPLDDKALRPFLRANKMVPIAGEPLKLLPNLLAKQDPLDQARRIYNQVDALVKYDKSKPGYGNGDVLWVCDSRTGNCTDFHSLFISMARSQAIPARFEIGFPIGKDPEGTVAGYHCWASFYHQGRWIPVDISEADKHPEMKQYYFGNLTEDRVQFSIGRDLMLTPRQEGPPLNYFVYPYVEVDGKTAPREQIQVQFSYRDLISE